MQTPYFPLMKILTRKPSSDTNRYCSDRGPTNCNLVIMIFRCSSGTLDLEITITADSEDELVDLTHSNYARLIGGQKYTGVYIFMPSGGLLSHQSKLQSTATLLSTEAKYMPITKVGKEALWVAQFLACLGFCLLSQLVDLRADNKGAISLTENPEFYR